MSLVGFKVKNHPQQVDKNGADDDTDDRGTKPEFIAELEERFGKFDLDVAAAPHNAKAARFFTRGDDGLAQEWDGGVWCNPPYSNLGEWVAKAWYEWNGCPCGRRPCGENEHLFWPRTTHRPDRIIMLVPANRTEQGWWQEWVEPYRGKTTAWGSFDVEFLRGRMRFDRPGVEVGPKGDRPPFGCCLLIWQRNE